MKLSSRIQSLVWMEVLILQNEPKRGALRRSWFL
jgi:hypothetical protein